MPRLSLLATSFLLLAGPALAAPGDAPAPAPQGTQSAPAPRPARTDGGVMRYDANKDGAVTLDEWKAGQQARFKRLDTNGDGKLSPDELFARTPAAGNSVLPTDRQAGRQSGYFQLLDVDKDGSVTLTEFLAGSERNFTRCDLDKNGRIDTAECRQALQRKPAER
ncbi:EF-hand domain-containing protein [Reyranella sp.]|uniref:EF-hand domain-containing protein n=1 Tax=Reyranella sp. TaxID=1929291 RepID=UPI003BAC2D10